MTWQQLRPHRQQQQRLVSQQHHLPSSRCASLSLVLYPPYGIQEAAEPTCAGVCAGREGGAGCDHTRPQQCARSASEPARGFCAGEGGKGSVSAVGLGSGVEGDHLASGSVCRRDIYMHRGLVRAPSRSLGCACVLVCVYTRARACLCRLYLVCECVCV